MHRFAGYILDLDGTVYRGEQLITGAAGTILTLRERGSRCVFLSNKPIQTREAYADKLIRLGIPVLADDVINSSFVLTEQLKCEAPGAKVFVLGEPPLLAELQRSGFRMADDPAQTDFVILALDRTLHYGKLLFAHRAVQCGARIWATNPDRTCPVEDGDIPDCAANIAAIEACTGRKVERVVGKPSSEVLQVAARRLGLPLSECLMVGDRLETDIVMARNAGCRCALVLTGVTTREAVAESNIKPDHVLGSITELL